MTPATRSTLFSRNRLRVSSCGLRCAFALLFGLRCAFALLFLVLCAGSGFAQRSRPVRSGPHDPNHPASWLGNHAIVIQAPENPTDAELAPVLEWIGSSRIVGLGDGTHGTHEFYEIKRRLIEELVRAGGVQAVLFEASWPDFNRLND